MKNNNPKGINFILIAMFIFAVQDSIMKYIYRSTSLYEVYIIRTLVSFLLIVIFLKLIKKPIIFKTHYPFLTFCRIILFFFPALFHASISVGQSFIPSQSTFDGGLTSFWVRGMNSGADADIGIFLFAHVVYHIFIDYLSQSFKF